MYTIKEQRKAHHEQRILNTIRPRIYRDIARLQKEELLNTIEKVSIIENLEDLFFKLDYPAEIITVFEPYKKTLQLQQKILNNITISLDMLIEQYSEKNRKGNTMSRREEILTELAEIVKNYSLDERLALTQTDNYKKLSYKTKKDVYNILFSPYYPAIARPEEIIL